MIEKHCSKCNVVKSINEFCSDQSKRDGFYSSCKKCHNNESLRWMKDNRIRFNESKRIRDKNRYANDINFKLATNLRNRLRKALLNQVASKNDKTEDLLGISYSEFKDYIEFLMTSDMGWKNIELDHVRPLSSFDLKDCEQLKEAAHYSNIQHLLAKDNRLKSNRIHEYDLWSQSEKLYDYETFKYYSQLLNE